MHIKKLRELIKDLPDDTLVLVTDIDHGFREANAEVTTGLHHKVYGWTEDFGDEATPEKQYGKRHTILHIA